MALRKSQGLEMTAENIIFTFTLKSFKKNLTSHHLRNMLCLNVISSIHVDAENSNLHEHVMLR